MPHQHARVQQRRCSSVVEHLPSKLMTRVRFPSPAPALPSEPVAFARIDDLDGALPGFGVRISPSATRIGSDGPGPAAGLVADYPRASLGKWSRTTGPADDDQLRRASRLSSRRITAISGPPRAQRLAADRMSQGSSALLLTGRRRIQSQRSTRAETAICSGGARTRDDYVRHRIRRCADARSRVETNGAEVAPAELQEFAALSNEACSEDLTWDKVLAGHPVPSLSSRRATSTRSRSPASWTSSTKPTSRQVPPRSIP
jgi:hypothetical protein